jgi:hypothetical protein
MPRDDLPLTMPITGPCKCTLTEKAKDTTLEKSTKRVRPTDPPVPLSSSPTDMINEDEDDDTFHSTISHQSYGTTPLNSSDEHDTDVMYKIDSNDSNSNDFNEPNVNPEEQLEQEQAELSMQATFYYGTMLTCYVQIALQKIECLQSMCSNGPLVLTTYSTIESMSLNAQPSIARESMATMYGTFWILAM